MFLKYTIKTKNPLYGFIFTNVYDMQNKCCSRNGINISNKPNIKFHLFEIQNEFIDEKRNR